ncbi:glycerol-3-phosphate acyltransferase [Candidatus Dependentiae bacterium]|nr:glycerol-3-phosphate acyltransferase [Candidatus Dependentiae bacterium]
MEVLVVILVCVMGYMIGAIPTGYFFCKLFFGVDITQYGSGNIGASNIGRVIGKKYFIFIAFIDALKAYGVLACTQWLITTTGNLSAWILYVGVASLLVGNAYSIFLNFRGGKGVATALGIMFFTLPGAAVGLFLATWAGVLLLSKQPFIASLASIVVVMSFLVIAAINDQALLVSAIAAWLVLRHSSNISAYLKCDS